MCKHDSNGHDDLHEDWRSGKGGMGYFLHGGGREESPDRRQNFSLARRLIARLTGRRPAAA